MTKQQQHRIVNLTQHKATPEQMEAGVVDIEEGHEKDILIDCLNFEEIPDTDEIGMKAEALAHLGHAAVAMIGGAPYLMAPLERALITNGIKPVYAFSKRESVEETQTNGSVKKTMVFRHMGFVEVSV